jgi:hypothetical protein
MPGVSSDQKGCLWTAISTVAERYFDRWRSAFTALSAAVRRVDAGNNDVFGSFNRPKEAKLRNKANLPPAPPAGRGWLGRLCAPFASNVSTIEASIDNGRGRPDDGSARRAFPFAIRCNIWSGR